MLFACYSLFPNYSWLAMMAFYASVPPGLLYYDWHGWRFSRRFLFGAFAWSLACGSFAALDLVRFSQILAKEHYPLRQGLTEILPGVVYYYGSFVLTSAFVMFAASSVLTSVVWVIGNWRTPAR
jgi:hypothetical protein